MAGVFARISPLAPAPAAIWVADIRNRDAMNEVWNAWTGGQNLPGRACIEARLADLRLLVEIAVVAVK